VIDTYEATLPALKNFILPGGTPKAAAFHLGSHDVRRAERSVVTLAREHQINPVIIHYQPAVRPAVRLARAVNKRAAAPTSCGDESASARREADASTTS